MHSASYLLLCVIAPTGNAPTQRLQLKIVWRRGRERALTQSWVIRALSSIVSPAKRQGQHEGNVFCVLADKSPWSLTTEEGSDGGRGRGRSSRKCVWPDRKPKDKSDSVYQRKSCYPFTDLGRLRLDCVEPKLPVLEFSQMCSDLSPRWSAGTFLRHILKCVNLSLMLIFKMIIQKVHLLFCEV